MSNKQWQEIEKELDEKNKQFEKSLKEDKPAERRIKK